MKALRWFGSSSPPDSDLDGWIFFQLGLFFLPSTAFVAAILLLTAMLLGMRQKRQSFLSDRWNYPFLIAGILMIIGCIRAYSGWLAWIGLANWLPFFWAFWSFQPYLRTVDARRRCALCLVFGTVPVLITGFGQLWFGWQGPWQLFGGLIIWFIAPGGEPTGRLSGLFDYANIAGAWLALVWPFCLAALLQPSLNFRSRSVVFALSSAVVAALVLTDSRNAWGGLVLAIPFVFGPSSWFWLFPVLILMLTPVALAVFPWVGLDLQQWARTIVPEDLWARLNDMRYMQQRTLASTRLSQWQVAISLIGEQPWLGWGAAAFSVLYPLRTGQWHGHAHNLPLELGVSHGIPVALLIVATVLALLITALRRGVLSGEITYNQGARIGSRVFDRAWWTATLILVVLHGADMPFFDSRLNIAAWVLLAGLRCLTHSANSLQHRALKPLADVEVVPLS